MKDPFEVQEGRCDIPRHATVEKGLIAPGGENLLDFLELSWFLSNYDGDIRDLLVWNQERPVSMRVARGLSKFLSSLWRGLGPHLDLRPEPQDSSPLLTRIFVFL